MTRRMGRGIVVAALAVGTLALGASSATAKTATAVSSVTTTDGKTVLVVGATPVYTLGGKTTCTAKCLAAHPAVLLPKGATAATAGAGVDAAKLGTAKAAKGARQVTYAGKRLFWSVKDKTAGELHGSGKDTWGTWATVTLTATPGTTAAPTPTAAPDTAPAATEPPATEPPATAPPETDPPAPKPDPPATTAPKSPGSGGSAF